MHSAASASCIILRTNKGLAGYFILYKNTTLGFLLYNLSPLIINNCALQITETVQCISTIVGTNIDHFLCSHTFLLLLFVSDSIVSRYLLVMFDLSRRKINTHNLSFSGRMICISCAPCLFLIIKRLECKGIDIPSLFPVRFNSAVLQIRRGNRNNLGITSHILP